MAPPHNKRIKTLSVSRPFIYGNTAKKIGSIRPPNAPPEHTHIWKLFIKGLNNDDISYFIKKVVVKLHDTYPNPIRTLETPPFEITETGWGEFEINIKIYFIDSSNEKFLNFYHHLRLHPYKTPNQIASTEEASTATTTTENSNNATTKDEGKNDNSKKQDDDIVSSVIYDEIIFNEPNETFLNVLLSKPGNYLPSNSEEINEKNIVNGTIFSKQLESDEIDRINLRIDTVEKEINELKEKIKERLASK
ncbi:hypothetical protein TBLA_0B01330 [Henningerozyma blattae CBS 6284]|uniref:Protein AF-9 homolog n=1 Tax=Henningerozyma blattae (strain ATCC 34711 / CBS 6284 / DSM 70876 / NBRC 10599 / NRRL Y-10934 / UCD 77-7) TaxID=1071380 RepID=I2GXX4_HENB6|nr:hypothetical protein TBLA_0B01330 [Tetrapisispora blattae CBS 6284]CCH58976.1 hypothetical protein TBLA_0B01330 [Tetrapisispora blattae CBS 6284]